MNKILTIWLCLNLILLVFPAYAASTEFIANGDITVPGVTFSTTTADMIIFDGSTAESWTFDSGEFSVTNPGSFHVGSADSRVLAFGISSGNTQLSCDANTVPGTSSTTLPTTSGTYTVTPSIADDCSDSCITIGGAATYNAYPTCGAASCSSGYTLTGSGSTAGCCSVLSNTAAYNAYPTCGAATCNSGYHLSGSGSSATCVVTSSGGGGGGGIYTPSTPAPSDTEQTQTSLTTTDGSVITTETTITKENNTPITSEVKADITPSSGLSAAQIVSLDSSKTSEIKAVSVDLPAVALQDIYTNNGSQKVEITVQSREALAGQKTNTARGSKFLIGFDVFDINIKSGGSEVKTLSAPMAISFDLTGVKYGNDLKIHYFNETSGRWEVAGDGGTISGDMITATVDHLTFFGLLFTIAVASAEEETDSRVLQLHEIYDEASVVFRSGQDLNAIIDLNGAVKNAQAQSQAMDKYTTPITKGLGGLTQSQIYAINNFILYGTPTTKILGAGERAGVINSYIKAFGKAPKSEEELKDAVAIANGRWPGETSASAEEQAKAQFKKIYLRDANMSQPNDNAAVTVIAYGLRPADRNLASESAAIKIFRGIFKYNPTSALDWDEVRAIAYSGATR